MAILDANLYFSSGQAVTDTKISVSSLQYSTLRQWAKGRPVYLVVEIDTGFTSAANVLNIQVATSSVEVTDASPVIAEPFPALNAALLANQTATAAHRFGAAPMPVEGLNKYVALIYYAETALVAGYLTAYLTLDPGDTL